MRSTLIRAAVLAAIVPLGASCAGHFPASPVPGAFSDTQANVMARNNASAAPEFAQPTGRGYIMAYHDDFDASATPPRPTRLVEVRYDGKVREYSFR